MPQTSTSPSRARPSAQLSDATLTKWLHDMVLIREFENRTGQAYQQAKIGGFCHLYTGQEAAVIGTMACVNPDDPIVTAYRDHGHALARGMDPRVCMAEMFGKAAGCARGKGGSMHMFDRPHWLFGGHGIVGAQTPLGAGLAFAAKYELEVLGWSVNKPNGESARREDAVPAKKRVALCYLGDGALNQGSLHEAMNLAGLYSLPVIYIVENNGYSMGTSIERGTTMAHDLRKKAEAYGIDSAVIDGFDVLELYDHFKPVVDRCRHDQRPAFVDLKTYRYLGHSMSDPQKYRTKEEVDQFKSRDSIDRFAAYLMAPRGDTNGSPKGPKGGMATALRGHENESGAPILSEADFQAMQKQIREVVREALEFAEKAPAPDPAAELYSDVLVNPLPGMSPSGEYVKGEKNPLM